MRSTIGHIGRQLSCAVPLGVWRRLVPRDVISLCYHVVSDCSLPHVRHLYPYKSLADFRQDLCFLKNHYEIIDYRQLHEHRLSGRPIPRSSVHITFDDGLTECYTVVRPVLLELGLPCTFFLNTDFLDNRSLFYRHKASLCIERLQTAGEAVVQNVLHWAAARVGNRMDSVQDLIRWIGTLNHADSGALDGLCTHLGVDCADYLAVRQPYMTRAQAVELVKDGFTIGGHTRNHQRLSRLNDAAEVRRAIVDSCQDIRDLSGQSVVPFAFPFSGDGVDRTVLDEILQSCPFIGLLFDTQKLKRDRDFVVNRICCDTPPAQSARQSSLPKALCNAYFSLTASLLKA